MNGNKKKKASGRARGEGNWERNLRVKEKLKGKEAEQNEGARRKEERSSTASSRNEEGTRTVDPHEKLSSFH